MWRRTNAHNPKLIIASNALYASYRAFSKELKKFGFVERVEKNKRAFQLPKQAN
ncbi:hypothetical protein [Lactobacillus acidophilus]|uniref:hypothetical protein n=1 Tax=Lactobacillus acidophilus TaxID=1579 RepID=UPI0021A2D27E|nr:hypothetical protein [Lactobacillus acidophilus]